MSQCSSTSSVSHSYDELYPDSGSESASNTIHAHEDLKRRALSKAAGICLDAPLYPGLAAPKVGLTIADKHQEYHYAKPMKQGLRRRVKEKFWKKPDCSKKSLKGFLVRRLPFIECASNYNLKTDLCGDIISGITVAVMHIPQGMAYAMLGNLDPIVGIYMALFPVLFYAIFASSRHCSMGTFAVICLMTGKLVAQYATFPEEGESSSGSMSGNGTFNEAINGTTVQYSATEVSTIVSFCVAIWMIIFGFLNLGSLSVFLSDMFISGFTTGAAVQVFTSQLKSLFGVSIKTYNGAFQIILTWKALFETILESNAASLVISMLCIAIITFNNDFLKPRLRKLTRIPFPIEFIMVVLGTAVSMCLNLKENYGVKIVGHVPSGLPPPSLPPFGLFGQVFIPSLTITIVSFSISYSMAKLFAKKHDYTVDPTQELYATGIGNVVGSFFQCAPISASLSRSVIQETVGGVTQLTSFISCSIVVLALLFIGPFVEPLPHCVLAAIIVSAIKGMFSQVSDFTRMWKVSKGEACIWLISFLGVVVIDVDYGLLLGIFSSMLLLIYKSQTPTIAVLGKIPNTDIYLDKDRYVSVVEIAGLKMLHVAGTLHFANQESFHSLLVKASGVDPRDICKMEKKFQKKLLKEQKKNSSPLRGIDNAIDMACSTNDLIENEDELKVPKDRNKPNLDITFISNRDLEKSSTPPLLCVTSNIIIDLSGVGQMDISGAKNLAVIYKEYATAHIAVYYCSLSETCMEMMETYGALEDIPLQSFFHSIQDAVFFITAPPPPAQPSVAPEEVNQVPQTTLTEMLETLEGKDNDRQD